MGRNEPPARDVVADAKRVVERRRIVSQAREVVAEESRRLLGARLKERAERRAAGAAAFRAYVRRSADGAHAEPLRAARIVAPGASVAEASGRAVREGIANRVNGAATVGAAVLDDEEAAVLMQRGEVPAAELFSRLRPPHQAARAVLVRNDPLRRLCREHARLEDPCVKALTTEATDPVDEEPDPVPDPGGNPGDNGGPQENGASPTLPVLVGNLVDHVASPESPQVFKVATRAGLEDVQSGVDGFALHSGPADVAAHYEFHRLQIAFEHVWQELFDSGADGVGGELFAEIVELGFAPDEILKGTASLKDALASLDVMAKPVTKSLIEPPVAVIRDWDITAEEYTLLDEIGLGEDFATLAGEIATLRAARDAEIKQLTDFIQAMGQFVTFPPDLVQRMKDAIRQRFETSINELRRQGDRLVRYADRRLERPEDFEHFHELLAALRERIREPYRFRIYAAQPGERSVNFGIVVTYVQRWQPVSYQVGRLVKTVTLAPKEVRRFSRRTTVKRSRAEKETESSLSSRRSESSETSSTESEIVQKAMRRTNFQLSAEGGVNIGIAHAKGGSSLGQDAASESQETKQEFREAVFKAAQEYRSERTVEVQVDTTEEASFEESGEISNPNDELPVTYLFYELQRRYAVDEQIRRITPIVCVAQEFPTPSEIDDDWLVAHDWILRRVLLDDSFVPALDYITTRIAGDEYAMKEQYQNLRQHRALVDQLGADIVAIKSQVGQRYAALQRSVQRRADAIEAEESEGFLEAGGEGLFGSMDASPEALRVREDAARDAYERAAKDEKELLARLERETTALEAITDGYVKALSEHLNRKSQIARLRVHVKQNAMYYMQAIWSHEPPDQRFFRLHDVPVPRLEGSLTYSVHPDPDAVPVPPEWKKPHKLVAKATLDPDQEHATLEELADLDQLLGFKGNYMLFPLRESNVLTDFMMTPYFDAEAGLRDPDLRGNWSLSDFVDYVCCLRKHLSPTAFQRLRPGLQEAYVQLVSDPAGDGEEIVTPTDSLFIEALPGAHAILEDFKLMHRAMDVKRAQADVRAVELENLRAAARLLTQDFEDPTIERKIVIEGGEPEIVQPTDDP
jgi:hypothetical protein